MRLACDLCGFEAERLWAADGVDVLCGPCLEVVKG